MRENSPPKPSCVPIKRLIRLRSWPGSSCGGQWKSPFTRYVPKWRVETQRQWSDLAILRTTPALLGLFSLVTIFAHQLLDEHPFPVRQAAWYAKALPTFSDTLALVRQHLWPSSFFARSSSQHEMVAHSTGTFRAPRGYPRLHGVIWIKSSWAHPHLSWLARKSLVGPPCLQRQAHTTGDACSVR